jgi:hypothetical protein
LLTVVGVLLAVAVAIRALGSLELRRLRDVLLPVRGATAPRIGPTSV